MIFPGWRSVALALLLFSLGANVVSATDIKTRRGEVYMGAKIVRRDGVNLDITTSKGKALRLLMTDISEMDGVQLLPAPTPAPTAAASTAPSTAPSTISPVPTPALPPPRAASTPFTGFPRATPRPLSRYSTPAGEELAPLPSASVVPTATSSPPVMQQGPAEPVREFPSENEGESSLLLIIGGGLLVWFALMAFVWYDLRRREAKTKIWFYVAVFLPVAGGIVYIVFGRTMRKRKRIRTGNVSEPFAEFQFLNANHELIAIKGGSEASGIQNAKDILNDALLDRASDVHIEPSASEYRIRFRVDGMLYSRMKFNPEEGIRLVSAVKSLAEMDISEKRKAQDGRFGGRRGTREVDFRVATTPTVFGEKLVVRVLDSKTGLRGLNELGMTETMMAEFTKVIHSRNGMIISTGPTGSGKTSTLYAALAQLDANGLNLVTIEDPVEYQLAGATQIPVNVRAGVTYESGLRSVLRQDPDVILVGEMRDREAAQIALRSALTGHLVFSTLHTQNSIGTITRLEEIGIERHLLASSLFVVMAQRLVRVICPHCKEAYKTTGEELVEVGLELPAGADIFRAKGCRRCDGTGYLGRTGVFEMLIFDDELRQAVTDGAGETEMYEIAHRKGYRGYREDAAMKILLGVTTVDEVLKAV